MTAHHRLRPSGAARWLACTASPRLEEASGVEDKGSAYAQEGTDAHAIYAVELRDMLRQLFGGVAHSSVKIVQIEGTESTVVVDICRNGIVQWRAGLDAEATDAMVGEHYCSQMQQRAEDAALYVVDTARKGVGRNPVARIELPVRIPATDGFGTVDTSVTWGKELHIFDLKYGHTPVAAENNPQLKLYAYGSMLADTQRATLHIMQPRHEYSRAAYSREQLVMFGSEVAKAVQSINMGGATKPGAHCKYCKAKPQCRAYFEHVGFVPEQAAELLAVEEVRAAIERAEAAAEWAKAAKEWVASRLHAGDKVPGFKLVQAAGRRELVDTPALHNVLEGLGHRIDDFAPRSLLGVTAMNKLLGKNKKALIEHTRIKPGNVSVAYAEDKSPEWKPEEAAASVFENLDE